MVSAVELGAFDGRRANSVLEFGGAINFPRFPITVGVPVTLLIEGRSRGNGVRVQNLVVLRQ
jgi:hypothetical protein